MQTRKRKAIFVAVSLLVCFGIFIAFIMFSVTGNKEVTENIDPTDSQPNIVPTSIDRIATTTSSTETLTRGDVVSTKDFLEDLDTVADPANDGHYYLGNSFPYPADVATNSPPYIIEYIAPTDTFNIVLIEEPIADARAQVEQYLMMKLGRSQDELCYLNYILSVPADVNDIYAGNNLMFSFCPNAIQL